MHNDLITLCFEAMKAKAKSLGVKKGTFAILPWSYAGVIYFSWISDDPERRGEDAFRSMFRGPDPLKGEDDNGANYLGVVMGKIAQCARTGQDSCMENAIKGESTYRGAVVSEDGQAIFGFSGGTQDQDVEIVIAGKETYEREIKRLKNNK